MEHHADYTNVTGLSKKETLEHILTSYEALVTDNWVSNLSNCSSLLWHGYHSLNIPVNWTGFYLKQDNNGKRELVLGPFQGKVACQVIQWGKGVCGTAAATSKTQLVSNVNEFPGHIACDGETKSEIVVPIVKDDGEVVAIIDLDCLELNAFDEEDVIYLEKLAKLISKCL
ncbi:YKL069W [Candida oxycetoniae]|uniref:YKL069W n=1 Tax=Candida oxycetoniae TaxID=497107 RepID=A0AAI9WWF5_9ASCO|nr:YKL069W [Candida oxycetoniae]KAI3403111.1 YKL069W [Candida oxycetoniae]